MATYYVATNGNDSNPGTLTQPWRTLAYATDSTRLGAGDTLWVRGGTYTSTYGNSSAAHLWVADLVGTSGSPIVISAYSGEVPILDLSAITSTEASCFAVFMSGCSYLTFKGIIVTGLAQNGTALNITGIFVTGCDHITIENCKVHHIGGFGISINDSTYVTCKNSDAYYCLDPYTSYENANGFGVTGGYSENTSDNITFEGCRAWKNADDGFDFYGVDSYITLNACWSFWNGYDDSLNPLGNGQGFKLGPMYHDTFSSTLRRVVTNCIAAKNRTNGFDQNTTYPGGSWPGTCIMHFYNNIAYDNGSYGWNFNYNPDITNLFHNNVAFDNDGGQVLLQDSTNTYNSWNGGVTATTADFEGMVVSTLTSARQSNGDLPVLAFGHLVTSSDLIGAGLDVSLTLDGAGVSYNTPPSMGSYEFGSIPATSVTVSSATSVIVTNGGTLQMTATVLPANATNKTVTWSVVNGTGSATIDSSGLLTAVTNGTVTVVATANG